MPFFRFKYDLAKLTVVISDPNVMVIKKDIKTTFTEGLGVIGILRLVVNTSFLY